MSEHSATIRWTHAPHAREEGTYSRRHKAILDGGQTLDLSAAIAYKGDPDHADPEQLLVSAVSSCHMLFFLAIAEVKGFKVASYEDNASAYLEKDDEGRLAITRIVLRPDVTFAGDNLPDATAIERIHAGAHRNCFIANSLKSEVVVEPT